MLHAHFINIATPGSYATELNKVLKLNNLPEIKIPEDPPSTQIIIKAQEAENAETERDINKQEENKIIEEKSQHRMQEDSDKTIELRKEVQEKQKNQRMIKGGEIGLNIYTTKSEGWPKTTLTKKNLLRGIEENKYKYTYTNEMMEDEEIMNLIKSNEIDLTDCFDILEDTMFSKISSGKIKEISPSPQERQREISK